MNVRLHLLCFVTAVLLGGFGSLLLFAFGTSLLAALFGETLRNWFTIPMIILFLVSPILVVNLFARIPVRCWRTGCSGRATLLSACDTRPSERSRFCPVVCSLDVKQSDWERGDFENFAACSSRCCCLF